MALFFKYLDLYHKYTYNIKKFREYCKDFA